MATGVCSYDQKHVIDALEGFSQFLARNWEKPFRASITCFGTYLKTLVVLLTVSRKKMQSLLLVQIGLTCNINLLFFFLGATVDLGITRQRTIQFTNITIQDEGVLEFHSDIDNINDNWTVNVS